MFGDKVFQTVVFSRHRQEASHCYENFGLEWSFKYSKKITWYLANHGIQNKVFYMPYKILSGKNTMVFCNTMVLPQNCKNTFPNAP
jgi:hypothetical protein